MVASLQRVAAASIEIEPSASRDEDVQRLAVRVVQSLEEIPPAAVFVQLIEDHETAHGKRPVEHARPRLVVIPIEVTGGIGPVLLTQEGPRQRGLPGLPRAGEQHHLRPEIGGDLRGQRADEHSDTIVAM